MARWRKVDLRIHDDERYRALSAPKPNGQDLFLDLLIGRRTTNIPGVIVARLAILADDRRWPLDATRKAFQEAIAKGLAKVDLEVGLIWLPKAPKQPCNKPQSPNVVKHWGLTFDELPECELKAVIWKALRKWAERLGHSYLEAFLEAFPNTFPDTISEVARTRDQEQEQKQKQEQDLFSQPSQGRGGQESSRTNHYSKEVRDAAAIFVERFNEAFTTPTRKRMARAPTYYTMVQTALRRRYTAEHLKAAVWGASNTCGSDEFMDNYEPKTILRLTAKEGRCLPQWVEAADEEWERQHPGETAPWRQDEDR